MVSALTTTSILSAQASTTATIVEDDSGSGAKGGECQLLGEASIFIQGALGALALLSLVYKRWRERPQRPLKIWFFDVSKQLCPWLVRVGDWALRWTEGNETVQVFFVMLFFPVVMNALQYYIIDGFIKNQKPQDADPNHDNDEGNDDGRTQRPRTQPDDDRDHNHGDDADLPDEAVVASDVEDKPPLANGVTKLRIDPKRLNEYDPATDGESSPAPSEIHRRNSPGGGLATGDRDHTERRPS
ncbi:MAG: hypothetical protein Q9201_004426 [Fulgogasparrea decipioides]